MAHFDQQKANITFSRALEKWTDSQPTAAINCFADGGTNAHVIVEAWEKMKTRHQAQSNIASSIKETNAFARRAKAGSGDFKMTAANIWDTYEVEV